MAKKNIGNMIGAIAFLVGIVVAVVFAVLGNLTSPVLIALVIVGFIIGLLNITSSEATPFLLSGAVLIIASSMGGNVLNVVPYLGDILKALLVLFVPATIIVAIRNVFSLARN